MRWYALLVTLLWLSTVAAARAADLFTYEVTPLKASDCVTDLSNALFVGYCNIVPYIWTAYSPSVTDYELTDFGVLHEVDRGGPNGNLSMGVHVYGLGAWNFR